MPKGGKRTGAGAKKGSHHKETLDKLAAREFVRQRVTEKLGPLIDAQIANAQGLKYLVVRDKHSGKFLRVTEAMAKQKAEKLADNEEIIEVWEKDPSVQAFSDLVNRAIDKPKEQEQEIKLTGEVNLVSRLHAARARHAKALPPARGE